MKCCFVNTIHSLSYGKRMSCKSVTEEVKRLPLREEGGFWNG